MGHGAAACRAGIPNTALGILRSRTGAPVGGDSDSPAQGTPGITARPVSISFGFRDEHKLLAQARAGSLARLTLHKPRGRSSAGRGKQPWLTSGARGNSQGKQPHLTNCAQLLDGNPSGSSPGGRSLGKQPPALYLGCQREFPQEPLHLNTGNSPWEFQEAALAHQEATWWAHQQEFLWEAALGRKPPRSNPGRAHQQEPPGSSPSRAHQQESHQEQPRKDSPARIPSGSSPEGLTRRNSLGKQPQQEPPRAAPGLTSRTPLGSSPSRNRPRESAQEGLPPGTAPAGAPRAALGLTSRNPLGNQRRKSSPQEKPQQEPPQEAAPKGLPTGIPLGSSPSRNPPEQPQLTSRNPLGNQPRKGSPQEKPQEELPAGAAPAGAPSGAPPGAAPAGAP
ncbi:translation initiation factor IF-2-like [Pyrgilauda ruficollis]|uniref:translation initiation factor IF-2-like n=1 Tax=Pyrgilauda ruficollis TaxID=221976 RepID=UPI001B86A6CB|nr:translation initiation factor IF-2-like [Pyrgilauda ruficollis]